MGMFTAVMAHGQLHSLRPLHTYVLPLLLCYESLALCHSFVLLACSVWWWHTVNSTAALSHLLLSPTIFLAAATSDLVLLIHSCCWHVHMGGWQTIDYYNSSFTPSTVLLLLYISVQTICYHI